jgi:MerR family mercuric resistance operon transcriptional regulator
VFCHFGYRKQEFPVALDLNWPHIYNIRTMVRCQDSRILSIGKFAEAGGVGVETVRYYQRKGLLETPPRGDGIRRYDDDHVRRLRFIRRAQQAGFTLAEIQELLELDVSFDRARAHELAAARITALDRQIDQLQRARANLNRLATECEKETSGPCPIIAAFDSQAS